MSCYAHFAQNRFQARWISLLATSRPNSMRGPPAILHATHASREDEMDWDVPKKFFSWLLEDASLSTLGRKTAR